MHVNKIRTHLNERWVKVETKAPTNSSNYFISNHGRVKSVNKLTEEERLLKCSRSSDKSVMLNLKLKDNIRQQINVSHFIAECYVEKNAKDQVFIIHKDGNKENNYYENLRWANRAELTEWQDQVGIYDRHRNNPRPSQKMTESKVRLLKQRLKRGKTKKTILARQFNITTAQVWRIEKGINWGHIQDE